MSIKVTLVNGLGGGTENDHYVEVGTTVGQFLSQRAAGVSVTPDKVLVRIRRSGTMFGSASQPIDTGFLLADGDTVSVAPNKLPGAQG